uniref:GIY-YIG endonuclease n=1 Tax=Fusarium begoniae TaxID=48487 RepID=A0A6M4AZX2_9HYPO|nr:GIY-YIG endonuclease [Fusarium begoniae]
MSRLLINKDNRNKSGIYRWLNKKDNKCYVGSATILPRRIKRYFSVKGLNNSNCRLISRALLKHGHSNFRLEILEHCKKDVLYKREQYYMDMYKPVYNILKVAGSSLGYKHSPEVLMKLKTREISNRGYSTVVINKKDDTCKEFRSMRKAAEYLKTHKTKVFNYANTDMLIEGTYLIRCSMLIRTQDIDTSLTSKNGGVKICNIDDNQIRVFSSKTQLAKYLGIEFGLTISVTTISDYVKSGRLYKNKYKIYVASGA